MAQNTNNSDARSKTSTLSSALTRENFYETLS